MTRLLCSLTLFACLPLHAASADYEVIEGEHSLTAYYNDQKLWTYNHDPAEGKPYFHPLSTTSGINLTGLRPDDHPWHRGMWFSWKYINGVNYWEESRETGLSDGRTSIIHFRSQVSKDKTTSIHLRLSYAPAGETTPVLIESRKIRISPPDSNGVYTVDWESEFIAGALQVKFDRTPIPGEEGEKNWGGYAGLSLRMNQQVNGGTFQNSEGLEGEGGAHRKPATWMSYAPPQGGFVLFMDHPQNINYPNKWYISEKMGYFSPAIVHDAPYVLAPGKSLNLQHRVVVAPEVLERSEIKERLFK